LDAHCHKKLSLWGVVTRLGEEHMDCRENSGRKGGRKIWESGNAIALVRKPSASRGSFRGGMRFFRPGRREGMGKSKSAEKTIRAVGGHILTPRKNTELGTRTSGEGRDSSGNTTAKRDGVPYVVSAERVKKGGHNKRNRQSCRKRGSPRREKKRLLGVGGLSSKVLKRRGASLSIRWPYSRG